MVTSPLALQATRPIPFEDTVEIHVNAGRYQEAVRLLADRYHRRRQRGDAEQLAAVLALAGEYEKASAVLLTLLDFQPTSADLHDRLADVYLQWGRDEEAATARRAAVVFGRAKQVIARNREPSGWAGRG